MATVDVYDPAADTWFAAPPMPTPRHHVAVAGHNGKLYACGGMTGTLPSQWRELDDLYEFDPQTQAWTLKAPMLTPRGEHLGIAFGDKIFFLGGRAAGVDSGANEMYDPATNLWTARAPMPIPRRSFAAVALDSLIYVVGGRFLQTGEPGEPTRLQNSSQVDAYSPASDTWYTLSPLSTARGALAVGLLNGKLYAMGGEFFNDDGTGGVFSENEEYDPVTDSWRNVNAMNRPVHGTGAVTIGNTIYILGGASQVGVFATNLAQGFTMRP